MGQVGTTTRKKLTRAERRQVGEYHCVLSICGILVFYCALVVIHGVFRNMSSLTDLIQVGKDLGYEGPELQSFVKEEQARERDEREQERNQKKIEAEHALELETIRRQTALELDKIEREREEREEFRADRDHTRKLELLQAEPAVGNRETGQPDQEFRSARGPKLSPFEEGKDNVDAYIERFIRYATAQKWSQNQWGANLGALLKGKALDVFTRLSVEDSLNFDELKKALLKRFEKTEEGFRKSFRSERLESGETFGQFAIRLDSYLEKWVEMTDTDKSYAKLKDLMVRDQFLHCCGRELALFLKERVPSSVREMAKLADQFAEARGSKTNLMIARPSRTNDSQQSTSSTVSKPGDKQVKQFDTTANDKRCYACHKIGHRSFECTTKKNSSNRVAGMTKTEATEVQSSQIGSSNRQNLGRGRGTGRGRGRRNNQSRQYDAGSSCAFNPDTPALSESCNADLSVATSMPVVRGCIGGYFVTVLRDSGCSGVVVRKGLVKPSQITERNQLCSLADGSRIQVPIAEVDIDTPYLTGSVEAWVLETPLYDLIIGNVKGARPPEHPDENWMQTEECMQAVETRAQHRRMQQDYRPLKVPQTLADMGDVAELKKQQQEVKSLSKVMRLAEDGSTVERNDGGNSVLYYHKGLLYRKFHSPKVSNGKTFRQLVVPQKFRQTVLKLAHDYIMAGHLGAKRTVGRILAEFFWPGIQADVIRYCRSCDVCQRTVPKGRITKAPLGSML